MTKLEILERIEELENLRSKLENTKATMATGGNVASFSVGAYSASYTAISMETVNNEIDIINSSIARLKRLLRCKATVDSSTAGKPYIKGC